MNRKQERFSRSESSTHITCPECLESILSENYSVHVAACRKNKFQCEVCKAYCSIQEKPQHSSTAHLIQTVDLAILKRDEDHLKELLELLPTSESVNFMDLIYKACTTGSLPCVRTLVEYETRRKGTASIQPKAGIPSHSSLMVAAQSDNISMVQYLLQLGVDVNYKDQYMRTALMYACKRAAYNTLVLLLNSAAKINLRDINGMTAIHHLLSEKNDPQKVMQCLEVIVEVSGESADLTSRDREGATPLYCTILNSNYTCAEFLLQHNANVDYDILLCAVLKNMTDFLQLFLNQDCSSINEMDASYRTLIHWACYKGHVESARILLDFRCQVNRQDNKGKTALHYACENGHYELVKLLLERNPLDIELELADKEHRMPLSLLHSEEELELYYPLFETAVRAKSWRSVQIWGTLSAAVGTLAFVAWKLYAMKKK